MLQTLSDIVAILIVLSSRIVFTVMRVSCVAQAIQDLQPQQDTYNVCMTEGLSRTEKNQTTAPWSHSLEPVLTGGSWAEPFHRLSQTNTLLPSRPFLPLLPLSSSFPKQGNCVQRTEVPL